MKKETEFLIKKADEQIEENKWTKFERGELILYLNPDRPNQAIVIDKEHDEILTVNPINGFEPEEGIERPICAIYDTDAEDIRKCVEHPKLGGVSYLVFSSSAFAGTAGKPCAKYGFEAPKDEYEKRRKNLYKTFKNLPLEEIVEKLFH